MGYKLAILPALLFNASVAAFDNVLHDLKRSLQPPEPDVPVAEVFRRFGADKWDALRSRISEGNSSDKTSVRSEVAE
jgi:hypothetical protein